jgi:hypothetical protein
MAKKKEITIKASVKLDFDIKAYAPAEHWDEADDEAKDIYVREQVRQHLLEDMDEIIYDIVSNSKLEY